MQEIFVHYFCILLLYQIYWLALVVFWWHLWDSLCVVSCHLQTVTVLLLLFQFTFLLFLFLLWLPWLGLPKLLNNGGEIGHPCLAPDLRGNAFSFSPFRMMFSVCLSYMAFIMLRSVPSIPTFWSFYHKWLLNFVKSFFCFYWDDNMVFIHQFVNNGVSHWFAYIEESLHPWDKSHLIMVYDPFNVLLDSVC